MQGTPSEKTAPWDAEHEALLARDEDASGIGRTATAIVFFDEDAVHSRPVMKHVLVQLADEIDWAWVDDEMTTLYRDNGRPS